MALEGTDDMEQACKITKLCQFIHDGKLTRTGRIVDMLLQADKDVTYVKVKPVIERLDISKKIPSYGESFKDNFFSYKLLSHSKKQISKVEISKIN